MCTCGHPLTEHQTGEGPWTGFCYGTLKEIQDAPELILQGADPNEPCACEEPTLEMTLFFPREVTA